MTVGNLIKNKDYDLIMYRITLPEDFEEKDTLFGYAKSENGELISLDGDSYYKDEEILSYEEWSNESYKNGLTVVMEGGWLRNNK